MYILSEINFNFFLLYYNTFLVLGNTFMTREFVNYFFVYLIFQLIYYVSVSSQYKITLL